MLQLISASRLPYEWKTIGPALAPAIDLDPVRDSWTVLDNALSGHWQFWRVGGSQKGFLVTEALTDSDTGKRALWVIYVAGMGGSIHDKRALMALIESKAREQRCVEVRFEGRDWRRVLPDYQATQAPDGRWNFRKVI